MTHSGFLVYLKSIVNSKVSSIEAVDIKPYQTIRQVKQKYSVDCGINTNTINCKYEEEQVMVEDLTNYVVASTPVLTQFGYKKVEELTVNDKIVNWSVEDNKIECEQINIIRSSTLKEYISVSFCDVECSCTSAAINCSIYQAFFCVNKNKWCRFKSSTGDQSCVNEYHKWESFGDLEIGDYVLYFDERKKKLGRKQVLDYSIVNGGSNSVTGYSIHLCKNHKG